MASGSLGNQTTLNSSYTPSFTWTDTTNLPTVQNIVATYTLLDSRLLILTMRYNLVDKGDYTSNSALKISLPPGLKCANSATGPAGIYYYNIGGPSDMVIRTTLDDNTIRILYRIGGGYSAPQLPTGYQGLFAVIPVKPA